MKSKLGLTGAAREALIQRFGMRGKKPDAAPDDVSPRMRGSAAAIPDAYCRFDRFPGYEKLLVPQAAAKRLGLPNPFFRTHEGVAGATTQIEGRTFVNFSSYNYLGLAGHPRVNQAAKEAIDRYGTSASASRLVAGERPIQRELEQALAEFYEVEDCVVFVSGHATNVTTIGYLFGPRDLIVHDALIHNSVLEGARLSGATRRSFPHNDTAALEAILGEIRGQFERTLIVVEGLYSMDGDIPNLPALIDIKRRYKAFLMVDEAHSLGVLGASGRGLREHYGVAGTDVDIWMGTLSKALAGCGGYIAGERALVEHLKYAAPGFVYSVGMAPPLAAASLAALELLCAEPERVHRLRERAQLLFEYAKSRGIDTGLSQGYAVVPALTHHSLKAAKYSEHLFTSGFNVMPIIYPAVEERGARLRFFASSLHTETQIRAVVDLLAQIAS
ncbi:MAG: aminotransferase class I/II-fold pyridoxal phosphate-dependent enzyme [Betaproteobacteria bacterium]|jgi:8-amino-7-oxononanoate synthase|nr:aminotransferase class I/II-fold pyridoxal phosphate-dependent enzyme [Betaproteobacteria bacterium]HMV20310.1 aminotransferase class I/II-fold pyridoxal phosphate-dependent enzyme [Rhodocyclaceae bacterium]HNE41793.1 aminotransferase class I/II-fold pyridoxal phosphate-dependent enzyme [Rhodocyclaceae bacterium]HNL21615.1 aminotransferase class I/II-fold pyridoxal phosphate-dependent enzyme [Rhodocyclaceae bacterium]HNM20865.1 aminotransferase class I/II-fold pyridoxal phosphate-dependent e